MYLEKLLIKKFRSIDELELNFNKDLNIIIGENNSGKSAIIDALRICLSISKQWRDIGIRNSEDFYIDISEIKNVFDPIEFHLTFKVEKEEDAQRFVSMVAQDENDTALQTIQLHFKYFLEDKGAGKMALRWTSWGGDKEGQTIKPEEAQLIYFSYLAPLRNAELELRPYAKENKVISLFREMSKYQVTEDDGQVTNKDLTLETKRGLAKKLESVVADKEWQGLIKSAEKLVNEHLEKADIAKKESRIHLRLLEYEYNNIVKGILMRKPVYADALLGADPTLQKFFDVSQNGLGENNLIYASAVLGDLKNRRAEKKEHYYALLIEEPESHLHPQKQNTFFNYLNNLRDLEVQIFITSHSPTLTAKSDLDNLFVLQRQLNKIRSFAFLNSELTISNKQYLRKFLDVTKSQLFFANGVLLVEGISEALLLPVFAQMIDKNYDLDRNGIEIVNVDGVAFEPFARLFNSDDATKKLHSRCSIITDNDKGLLAAAHFISVADNIDKPAAKAIFDTLLRFDIVDRSNRIINFDPAADLPLGIYQDREAFIKQILTERVNRISDRATKAIALENGNLKVKLGEVTFEHQLFVISDFNMRVMRTIYQQMHPNTEFLRTANANEMGHDFLAKLVSNKDKSQFAENLAIFLETRPKSRSKFLIPDYLQSAIKWAIRVD